MAVIIGINTNHAGSSAAISIDGELKFAIAEERLNRIKYYANFPKKALLNCLDYANLDFKDIDYVGIGRDSKANLKNKLKYLASNPLLAKNLLSIGSSNASYQDLKKILKREYAVDSKDLRFEQINIEHHMSHTASAFFQSGFKEAAGITIDGSGDFVTCMMSKCKGNEIIPLHKIYVPNSLGSFYNVFCQFIGYEKYGDEGKVMGLAPLGKDIYKDFFREIISFKDGQIKLNNEFFMPFGSNQGIYVNEKGQMEIPILYSQKLVDLFGKPREPNSEIKQRDMDIAASLQKRFEEIYIDLFEYLYSLFPVRNVVVAGGCALNSVANGLVYEKTKFKNMHVHPAAGDDGLAVGALKYISHSILNEKNINKEFSVYLGNYYSDEMIEKELKLHNIEYKRIDKKYIACSTAKEINNGKVVGWFQGRSEWGPRALGNRSILCHPGFPNMKDILNARIKRREFFRPFAPAVKEDKLNEIFNAKNPTPHMLHVYEIKEEWRNKLSAVNHVDNTGRVQTVNEKDNPLYFELISEFEKLSGIPVLLNTSFNENEPIVEKPSEAIDCFLRTKMDVIVIGSFLVKKEI